MGWAREPGRGTRGRDGMRETGGRDAVSELAGQTRGDMSVSATYSADFSSRVVCRLGSGGWPSSCRNLSTSCFATAYSPSVMVCILSRSVCALHAYSQSGPRIVYARQKRRGHQYVLFGEGGFCEISLMDESDMSNTPGMVQSEYTPCRDLH